MDWPTVLRRIDDVLASDMGRTAKAVLIAALVRRAGSYRWVGLYEVTEQEIVAIGGVGQGRLPTRALRWPRGSAGRP